MSSTVWAILLAPLITAAVWMPIRWFVRFLWRKLPSGRLKRILFSEQKWLDYPPGARRWDQ